MNRKGIIKSEVLIMKRKILIIFIVISMIMILFSGCKSKDVVSEDIDKVEIEVDKDDVKTHILKESIKDIETDFLNGVIEESEYHVKKINALIASRDELINKESEIKENMDIIPIDLSYDIQWMSNNYENLSDSEKEIFNNLINFTSKDNKESSLIDLFIKKVYADENQDPFVSIFTDNVVFYSEDFIYATLCEPILKSAFEKAYPKYESFF